MEVTLAPSNNNSFSFPDPLKPRYHRRSLKVAHNGEEPLVLERVTLEVLIPGVLYVVPNKFMGHLKPGQVLSRNLALTRQREDCDVDDPDTHVFIAYDDMFGALRSFVRMGLQYVWVERPRVRDSRRDINDLLNLVFELTHNDVGGRIMYSWQAVAVVEKMGVVMDPNKVSALTRMAKATSVKDRLGRDNLNRIPLLCHGADNDLNRRLQATFELGTRLNFRAVVCMAYVDAARKVFDDLVLSQRVRLQEWERRFGSRPTRRRMQQEWDKLGEAIDTLNQLSARPWGRSLRKQIDGLKRMREAFRAAGLSHTWQDRLVHLERARSEGKPVYRGGRLMQERGVLEDLLLSWVRFDGTRRQDPDTKQWRHQLLPSSQLVAQWSELLVQEREIFSGKDPVTDQHLDEGFGTWKVDPLLRELELAHLCLTSEDGPDFDGMFGAVRAVTKAI